MPFHGSMLTWQVIRDGLSYLLRGKFRLPQGHLPQPHRPVPPDFFGVGVASNADEATDRYIIEQLRNLGVKDVRLDLSYADLIGFQGRFCNALLDAGFAVTLRLIPGLESAKLMHTPAEQAHWKAFVDAVITRFGKQIKQIEIGNTINRKRWSGYDNTRFLAAWRIAHNAARANGIKLLGPNIQDFEPLYNISLLKQLDAQQQLPDVHTNNLFVERVSEPERFDHRILKYRWSRIFKFNLIKKARLLQQIGQDFHVPAFASTGAFWAIYRIERMLAHGVQKQADYLTRYFTLLAASGAVRQAFWGTLICHREGLISDGLDDADYPKLERVAHYQSSDGDRANYVNHPSFNALKTLALHLAGAQYLGALASGHDLEIHCFLTNQQLVHVAWTTNGKAILLREVYAQQALQTATYLHRDGRDFAADSPDLLCETPIYLCWPQDAVVETTENHAIRDALAIDAHLPDTHYYHCPIAEWDGLIAAHDHDAMHHIATAFNPNHLAPPDRQGSLRHARNVIWALPHPLQAGAQVTIKKPAKMYWHKQLFDRYRPTKARRSWNGAMELLRRGIDTPRPIAFFERVGDRSLKQNFYLCAYHVADCHIGQMFSAFAQGQSAFQGIEEESAYAQLARFIHKLHSRGCYFRDLSGGNILVNIQQDQLHFSLIDTARARFYPHGISMRQRLSDLSRASHKLNWSGRKRFLAHYLGLMGMQVQPYHLWPFYLYEAKVSTKRYIGRKGLKKLKQKLFS